MEKNNMHTLKKAACLILGFSLCLPCFANFANLKPVITLSGGTALTRNAGESQAFAYNQSQYIYSANHSRQTNGIYGGFAGAEMAIWQNWSLQFGLAYYQSSLAARGSATQGIDTFSSDSFNYKYNVLSRQWLIAAKLLGTWYERYHPYASLEAGAAFNVAKGYQTSLPPFLTFTPMFDNKTNHSFTYSVGIGLDVDVLTHWRAGVGYHFADLGKANLGTGYIDTFAISNTFKQSHLYTQELLAQLTYLF